MESSQLYLGLPYARFFFRPLGSPKVSTADAAKSAWGREMCWGFQSIPGHFGECGCSLLESRGSTSWCEPDRQSLRTGGRCTSSTPGTGYFQPHPSACGRWTPSWTPCSSCKRCRWALAGPEHLPFSALKSALFSALHCVIHCRLLRLVAGSRRWWQIGGTSWDVALLLFLLHYYYCYGSFYC